MFAWPMLSNDPPTNPPHFITPMNLQPITSLADPRVALYANMRDAELAQRDDPLDARAHSGVFIAEGELVVRRLVRSRFRTQSVLTTPARLDNLGDALHGLPTDTPVYLAPQDLLNDIVGFNMHRGLLAIGERPTLLPSQSDLSTRSGPVLVLEDLVNHDNLGGIFRNAAALGGPNAWILLSPRCADPLYRKSLRVSMGLVLSVPFARAESWPGALADLRQSGYACWAMTPADSARDLHSAVAAAQGRKIALVLGSEGPGLTAAAFRACDQAVRIEMAKADAQVDSLNVGMAAGIALYALGLGRS